MKIMVRHHITMVSLALLFGILFFGCRAAECSEPACWKAKAAETGDFKLCRMIENTTAKDNCYLHFVRTRHDTKACSSIRDSETKMECFEEKNIKTMLQEITDKISATCYELSFSDPGTKTTLQIEMPPGTTIRGDDGIICASIGEERACSSCSVPNKVEDITINSTGPVRSDCLLENRGIIKISWKKLT